MKEGVKVKEKKSLRFSQGLSIVSLFELICTNVFPLQDVCIPDLIKLLDILGDNGVILFEPYSKDALLIYLY